MDSDTINQKSKGKKSKNKRIEAKEEEHNDIRTFCALLINDNHTSKN